MTNVDMVLIAALYLRKQDQSEGGSGVFGVGSIYKLFAKGGTLPHMRGTSISSALSTLRTSGRMRVEYVDDHAGSVAYYKLTPDGLAQAKRAVDLRMKEYLAAKGAAHV